MIKATLASSVYRVLQASDTSCAVVIDSDVYIDTRGSITIVNSHTEGPVGVVTA